jgi:hypothetical protein
LSSLQIEVELDLSRQFDGLAQGWNLSCGKSLGNLALASSWRTRANSSRDAGAVSRALQRSVVHQDDFAIRGIAEVNLGHGAASSIAF